MATTPASLDAMIRGDQSLNALLGLTPHQIQAIAVMGYQLLEQGQTADAVRVFEGLTAVDAKSYFGFAGLGAAHLIGGRLEEAVGALQTAVSLDAEDATVQANLGEALLRLGRFEDAKPHLHRSMDLDPGRTDPGANRARAILLGISAAIAENDAAQGAN
ncbi:MAG: tetratricopeptide repeat protein [Bryobacteraceae bacterium]